MEKEIIFSYNLSVQDTRLLKMSEESASIYNLALKTFWDHFNQTQKFLSAFKIQKEIYKNIVSNLLHSDSKIGSIQQFRNAITSWWKAKEAYNKDPSKFSGPPKPPVKEKKTTSIHFKAKAIHFKDDFLFLSLKQGLGPIKIRWNSQLGIPHYATISWKTETGWSLNLVLKKIINTNENLLDSNILSIDLGVNRIAAVFDGQEIILFNGKEIKSLIQQRNKVNARTTSKLSNYNKHSITYKRIKRANRRIIKRINDKIKNLLHKLSRALVNHCQEKKVKTIVCGDNSSTHLKTNTGDNNQKISQGVEQQFRKYVQNKFEVIGGTFVMIPEHYTSKTCPVCKELNAPVNRNYGCKNCGFNYDRDGVGTLNIYHNYHQRNIKENPYLKVSFEKLKNFLNVVGFLTKPRGFKITSQNLNCWV